MALSITNETEIPLVVDLDGTVIKVISFMKVLCFSQKKPLNIFLIIRWLLCGISVLKIKLAERVKIDIESLPYNQSFLEFLKRESEKGRELILATASAQINSQKVAEHLRIFSKVLATDEKNNLRGSKKLERLVSLYGEKGFDYAGDSSTDIVIFPHCRNAHLINASDNTIKKAGRSANLSTVDKKPTVGLVHSLKAARIYQWTKNLLLFVPLVTSHNILNLKLFIINVLGFFAFSLCASATYIMNDLFDLESDRKHPRKKNRPFASGDLSISKGILMSGILGLSGLLLSFFLRLDFLFYIVFYILLTSLYSFFLKKHVLVDVLTLAGLYTIRIFAGAKLIGVNVSFWLFAFSVFLFFGLALVKRCTELQLIVKSGKMDLSGRDYCSEDLQTLRSMGITGSFISVVVFALYINSTGGLSLYARPELLWAICPALLLWINRLWIKTSRGQMHDDPLIFTLKDNVSRYLLLFIFLVVLIAQIR